MTSSIILSMYNGEKYILEQLDSLYKQTRKIDEVLIIDDCSSDNSVNICKKYILDKKLSTWNIIVNDKNRGYAFNFITYGSQAKSDIVYFCDQDDIWLENKIEFINNVFEQNKNALLVCSDLETFMSGNNKENLSKQYLKTMINDESIEQIKPSIANFICRRSGCTMAIKKDFLSIISNRWIESWPHDDMVWKCALLNNGLVLYHKVLIKRRLHSDNTSINKCYTLEKRIKQVKTLIADYESLKNYDYYCNEAKAIIDYHLKFTKKRFEFLTGKNFFKWFKLLKYKNVYQTKKGVFLDLYLKMFKKWNR